MRMLNNIIFYNFTKTHVSIQAFEDKTKKLEANINHCNVIPNKLVICLAEFLNKTIKICLISRIMMLIK